MMIAIIVILQRINEGGISPVIRLTFSDRSSIVSRVVVFNFILFPQFKLVFYEIVVRAFLFYEGAVVSRFNDFSVFQNYDLIGVFDR